MTNFTGAITAAASTTVAATTVRTQMQTTIPSNSAWTLVESTTMSSGAVPCDVYKCAAASSGLSADFYVAVMQSAGGIYMGIAEGYNTGTHKPRRPAVNATSTTQTLQADGGVLLSTQELDWFSQTFNPGGGNVNLPGANIELTLAITDDYIIAVAKDAIILFTRIAATFLYAGAYDTNVPTPATNDPLPILIAQAGGGTGAWATRMPLSGGASRQYPCGLNGLASAEGGGTPSGCCLSTGVPVDSSWTYFSNSRLGAATNADWFDRYGNQTSGVQALKVPVMNSYILSSTTAGRDKNGWLRGWFRHIRYVGCASTPALMDTCTVDGVGYTLGLLNTLWFETNPT